MADLAEEAGHALLGVAQCDFGLLAVVDIGATAGPSPDVGIAGQVAQGLHAHEMPAQFAVVATYARLDAQGRTGSPGDLPCRDGAVAVGGRHRLGPGIDGDPGVLGPAPVEPLTAAVGGRHPYQIRQVFQHAAPLVLAAVTTQLFAVQQAGVDAYDEAAAYLAVGVDIRRNQSERPDRVAAEILRTPLQGVVAAGHAALQRRPQRGAGLRIEQVPDQVLGVAFEAVAFAKCAVGPGHLEVRFDMKHLRFATVRQCLQAMRRHRFPGFGACRRLDRMQDEDTPIAIAGQGDREGPRTLLRMLDDEFVLRRPEPGARRDKLAEQRVRPGCALAGGQAACCRVHRGQASVGIDDEDRFAIGIDQQGVGFCLPLPTADEQGERHAAQQPDHAAGDLRSFDGIGHEHRVDEDEGDRKQGRAHAGQPGDHGHGRHEWRDAQFETPHHASGDVHGGGHQDRNRANQIADTGG